MALWDVFHSDRLELARGLSAEEIRAGLAAGSIRDDDLVRPSGTSAPWARVAEIPELTTPPAPSTGDVSFPVLPPEPPPPAPIDWEWETEDEDDDEGEDDFEDEEDVEEYQEQPTFLAELTPVADLTPSAEDLDSDDRGSSSSRVNLPAARSRDYDERVVADEEDDEGEGGMISLRRAGPKRVEELDLAAMVDVAFQLVLFFLVTATTILYKTLEIPKPSGEAPPEAVAQGRNRTLDDLREDYILVEIDPEGHIQVDREPVSADFADLAERLRTARETTNRTTMLLSADFSTPHRSAVLAYDVANEIGLGIAIAKPAPPAGPPPALRPAAAPKGEGA